MKSKYPVSLTDKIYFNQARPRQGLSDNILYRAFLSRSDRYNLDFIDLFVSSDTAGREDFQNWSWSQDMDGAQTIWNGLKVYEHLCELVSGCGDSAVTVSSFYRSPRLNRLIGGSSRSAHMRGNAVDIRLNIVQDDKIGSSFTSWLSRNLSEGVITYVKGYGNYSYHITFRPHNK